MAVQERNLSGQLRGKLSGSVPDIGQTIYVVDSNYRTAEQGWSRADRTGPLDLYEEYGAGRVFRTGDYSTDAACIQAAIDEMVDFRGDTLYFTPGSYSVGTALAINVPDARWTGPRVSHPSLSRASLTATVDLAFAPTTASDRFDLGNLQLVPLTAGTMWDCAALAGFHGHDLFLNWDGIAASTSTVGFVFASTAEFVNFNNIYAWVDGAQGPLIRAAGIIKGLTVSNLQIFLEAGTWATALDLAGVGIAHFDVGPVTISGGGTALTSLLTLADKTTDSSSGFVHNVRSSSKGPASTALAVPTTDTATVDLVDCWRAVAVDTSQPTFTSGAAITWECGVPFTG